MSSSICIRCTLLLSNKVENKVFVINEKMSYILHYIIQVFKNPDELVHLIKEKTTTTETSL